MKFVNDNDWIFCRVTDGKFDGGGNPGKLFSLLEIFKAWVKHYKEKPEMSISGISDFTFVMVK